MASGNQEHSVTDHNSSTTTISSTEETTTGDIENRHGQQKWSISFQEGQVRVRLDPMNKHNNSQLNSHAKTPNGSKYIRIAPAPAPAPVPLPSTSHLYLSNLTGTLIAGNAGPQLIVRFPCESDVELDKLKSIENLQTTCPKKRQLEGQTPKPKPIVRKVYDTAAGLALKRKNEQQAIPVGRVTPLKRPRRSNILDDPNTNTNGGQPRPPTATATRENFITLHYVQDITSDAVPTTADPPQPVEIPDFPEKDKYMTFSVLDSDEDMNEGVVQEPIVGQSAPYSTRLNGEGQGYGDLENDFGDLALEYYTEEQRQLEFERRRDQDQLQQAHDPSTVVCCPCQLNSSPFLSVIRPICTCSCLECEWQKCI